MDFDFSGNIRVVLKVTSISKSQKNIEHQNANRTEVKSCDTLYIGRPWNV